MPERSGGKRIRGASSWENLKSHGVTRKSVIFVLLLIYVICEPHTFLLLDFLNTISVGHKTLNFLKLNKILK